MDVDEAEDADACSAGAAAAVFSLASHMNCTSVVISASRTTCAAVDEAGDGLGLGDEEGDEFGAADVSSPTLPTPHSMSARKMENHSMRSVRS